MDRGGPRPGQDDRDLADRFKLNISDEGDGKCLNKQSRNRCETRCF